MKKLLNTFKSLPSGTKWLLSLGILLAFTIALPLFVWAITTQRFELRKRAQEIIPPQQAEWTVKLSPLTFPPTNLGIPSIGLGFFYSPSITYENSKYRMWTTINDRVRYYESTDGASWTGGQLVLTAQPNTWEDDGNFNAGENAEGGISDPRVVKNVTPGWTYTMYYTAGPWPNTDTRGGLGIAFSNDGINWTRWSDNPLRRFPGGGTFAVQALKIGEKRYVYFLGGGSAKDNISPPLRVIEDLGNGTNFGPDRILDNFASARVYPIVFDPATSSCYLGQVIWTNFPGIGPEEFRILKGSDCFTTPGTEIAVINKSITDNLSQGVGGVGIKERSPSGQLLAGTTSLQFYFAAGDAWAAWQPKSVIVFPPPESPTPFPNPCEGQPNGTSCAVCPACSYARPRCLGPCQLGTCQGSQCVLPPPPTPSCLNGDKGNLDCDAQGLINVTDLSILLAYWCPSCRLLGGRPGGWPPDRWSPDLNRDGDINATDLSILLSNWKPI